MTVRDTEPGLPYALCTDTRVDLARTTVILNAVKLAMDDDAAGDPDLALMDDAIVHPTLSVAARREWFAALLESTESVKASRQTITDGCGHHEPGHETTMRGAADGLDESLDRASLAVCMLLYGEPDLDCGATSVPRGRLLFDTLVGATA